MSVPLLFLENGAIVHAGDVTPYPADEPFVAYREAEAKARELVVSAAQSFARGEYGAALLLIVATTELNAILDVQTRAA